MPLYNLCVVNVVFSVAEEMIVKTSVLQHCSNTAFRRWTLSQKEQGSNPLAAISKPGQFNSLMMMGEGALCCKIEI